MRANEVFCEITPLNAGDCFLLFDRNKDRFDFPVHRHAEMELNLILNAGGSKRIVGDHSACIGDAELVLTGPNLKHGWLNHQHKSDDIREVTIQFHQDVLGDGLFNREQLKLVKAMFEASAQGIAFAPETIAAISPQILALSAKSGFDSVIGFLTILHQLSLSPYKCLSAANILPEEVAYHEVIDTALSFVNANYHQVVDSREIARITKIPADLFNRILKKNTGLNFRDCLTNVRLGHVSRLLIENKYSVGEIAYRCGFTNLASFHRLFRLKKNCTPKQFRDKYSGNRVVVY